MAKSDSSCKLVWPIKRFSLGTAKVQTKSLTSHSKKNPVQKSLYQRFLKTNLGQSTIEYVLMIAFGAVFSLQIVKFFNDIFRDGLQGLERNVQLEVQTGQGFGGNAP